MLTNDSYKPKGLSLNFHYVPCYKNILSVCFLSEVKTRCLTVKLNEIYANNIAEFVALLWLRVKWSSMQGSVKLDEFLSAGGSVCICARQSPYLGTANSLSGYVTQKKKHNGG